MSLPLSAKKVFLIPYWLENTLTRHQLPLSASLSLAKLKEVTSDEDLVLTLLLNSNTVPVFGIERYSSLPAQAWCAQADQVTPCERLLALLPLHLGGLQDRLFSEQTLSARYAAPFNIQDIGDDTFVVVIYPGYFGGPNATQHQNELVTALLKLFYGYSNYEVMARDPLFQQYLSRL